jgi:hypothetical protein
VFIWHIYCYNHYGWLKAEMIRYIRQSGGGGCRQIALALGIPEIMTKPNENIDFELFSLGVKFLNFHLFLTAPVWVDKKVLISV